MRIPKEAVKTANRSCARCLASPFPLIRVMRDCANSWTHTRRIFVTWVAGLRHICCASRARFSRLDYTQITRNHGQPIALLTGTIAYRCKLPLEPLRLNISNPWHFAYPSIPFFDLSNYLELKISNSIRFTIHFTRINILNPFARIFWKIQSNNPIAVDSSIRDTPLANCGKGKFPGARVIWLRSIEGAPRSCHFM